MGRHSKFDVLNAAACVQKALIDFKDELDALAPIERAFFLIEKGLTLHHVLEALKIAKSTYHRARRSKEAGRPIGHVGRPNLLDSEAENLIEIEVMKRNNLGDPMLVSEVCAMASDMLTIRNRKNDSSSLNDSTSQEVSRTWPVAFLKRHPSLELATAVPIEAGRHQNATAPIIRSWFEDVLRPLCVEHQYPDYMIANCDETMVQMSSRSKVKVVIPRLNGYKRIRALPTLTHITFVPTIFANGSSTQTLIIYPMKNLPSELPLEELTKPIKFQVTGEPSGWITKEIFEMYCKETIIPKFQRQREKHGYNGRGLLVVDGHTSRWNADLMQTFHDENIDVVTLVSHTSHICQPLDSLVFGCFKKGLRTHLRTALNEALHKSDFSKLEPEGTEEEMTSSLEDDTNVMIDVDPEQADQITLENSNKTLSSLSSTQRRHCLVETAKASLHAAMYPGTITKSFKVTGIFPLDVDRALKREGVRDAPDMEVLEKNRSKSKKRGRTSISGIVLSRADSIEMIQESQKKKQEKSKPRRKKKKNAEDE